MYRKVQGNLKLTERSASLAEVHICMSHKLHSLLTNPTTTSYQMQAWYHWWSSSMFWQRTQVTSEKAIKWPRFFGIYTSNLWHKHNVNPVNSTLLGFLLQQIWLLQQHTWRTHWAISNIHTHTHTTCYYKTQHVMTAWCSHYALHFFCTVKIRREWSRFCVFGVGGVGWQWPVRLLHLLVIQVHPKIDCKHNAQVPHYLNVDALTSKCKNTAAPLTIPLAAAVTLERRSSLSNLDLCTPTQPHTYTMPAWQLQEIARRGLLTHEANEHHRHEPGHIQHRNHHAATHVIRIPRIVVCRHTDTLTQHSMGIWTKACSQN